MSGFGDSARVRSVGDALELLAQPDVLSRRPEIASDPVVLAVSRLSAVVANRRPGAPQGSDVVAERELHGARLTLRWVRPEDR
jgi:hypothetical protein